MKFVLSLIATTGLLLSFTEGKSRGVTRALKGGGGPGGGLAAKLTGIYQAIDADDGSYQQLQVLCGRKNGQALEDECLVRLGDASFRNCPSTTGLGLARNVRIPLSDCKIELYCAPTEGGVVDFAAGPVTTLIGDFKRLQDGILQRPNGYTYNKVGP